MKSTYIVESKRWTLPKQKQEQITMVSKILNIHFEKKPNIIWEPNGQIVHNEALFTYYDRGFRWRPYSLGSNFDHICQFLCVAAEETDIISRSQVVEMFSFYIDTLLFP